MSQIPKGLAGIQLNFVDDVETAQRFLSWMGERRPYDAVAIDIETGEKPGQDKSDALSPWKGVIRLVQVGDGMTGWSIPWATWSGVFVQAMKNYNGKVVCHNIAFEGKWFELHSSWHIPWHNAHDTMIMARIINPLGSAALKTLSGQMVDRQAAALQSSLDQAFHDNGWTWGTVPVDFQPYWAYGALDCILTMRIFDQFWEKCGPGMEFSEPYELEMQIRKIANRMELNGATVDLDYSQKKLDQLTEYTESVKLWARNSYNGLSVTSPSQLAKQFTKMGAEISEYTPGGSPSINKDQLKMFVRDGSSEVSLLAEAILGQRKADKLAASYFSNFLSGNVNGVLHPSINTMAARTSRMSITSPALQTLPSGDATVRRAFIPKNEDFVIMASDLDQIEFRLTAAFSKDQKLIDLFNDADRDGADVFTEIMKQVYDDSSLVKEDPRRKLIKSTIYGKLYGAGPEKMALTSGVSTVQMQSVIAAFDSNYPGVKAFQKYVENQGQQRIRKEGEGYVTTAIGRRLPCDAGRVYALTNYLIQASAADIFKQNLVKLDQADLTDYMIVPVHDEIVLQVPKTDAKEIGELVGECMTTTEGWPMVLSAGVEGPYSSWGEKYLPKVAK